MNPRALINPSLPGKDVWIGGSPCQAEPKILWSWALDAPEFNMPTNVSMKVGNTEIQYLVMELHYKVIFGLLSRN